MLPFCYLPIAFLLLFSGFAKLLNPDVFRISLLLLPYEFGKLLSLVVYGIPTLEILMGFALFNARLRFIVLFLTLGVLCLFTFVMLYAHTPNALITCACFGYLRDLPLTSFLVRNSLLLLLCIAAIVGDYISRGSEHG